MRPKRISHIRTIKRCGVISSGYHKTRLGIVALELTIEQDDTRPQWLYGRARHSITAYHTVI